MSEYRLLPLTVDDAFTNMAVDEAISISVGRGDSPPSLRLYRWNPSAISIGCFQKLEYEVDVKGASERGIDVVRRITGGGSVFHDSKGELTYSFSTGPEDVPREIVGSFRKICGGIVEGLKDLGLNARYREVNDILVNGRKISGSAQTRRHGAVLQHGTILVDPDLDLMFDLLRVSREKISDKFVSSAQARVTSIFQELRKKPNFEEVRDAVVEGFEKRFGVNFSEGTLTEEERRMVESLQVDYASDERIGRR